MDKQLYALHRLGSLKCLKNDATHDPFIKAFLHGRFSS